MGIVLELSISICAVVILLTGGNRAIFNLVDAQQAARVIKRHQQLPTRNEFNRVKLMVAHQSVIAILENAVSDRRLLARSHANVAVAVLKDKAGSWNLLVKIKVAQRIPASKTISIKAYSLSLSVYEAEMVAPRLQTSASQNHLTHK